MTTNELVSLFNTFAKSDGLTQENSQHCAAFVKAAKRLEGTIDLAGGKVKSRQVLGLVYLLTDTGWPAFPDARYKE